VATDRFLPGSPSASAPAETAVAVDLDLSLINVRMPNLELRKADIVAGPVERGTFDLVTARAVLHHVADAQAAIAKWPLA
jgi:ubiquinone/menaquinone biosynthesis C-methylase UbiE